MKNYTITVNGNVYDVVVEEAAAGAVRPAAPVAPKAPAAPKATGAAGAVSVKAPMPGNIMKVNCKVGAAVKKGDVLIVRTPTLTLVIRQIALEHLVTVV